MSSDICRVPPALAIALAPGGCAVGPNYQPPQMAVPAHCKELPGWIQATPNVAVPKGEWWKIALY